MRQNGRTTVRGINCGVSRGKHAHDLRMKTRGGGPVEVVFSLLQSRVTRGNLRSHGLLPRREVLTAAALVLLHATYVHDLVHAIQGTDSNPKHKNGADDV